MFDATESKKELEEIAQLFEKLDKHKKDIVIGYTLGIVTAVELTQKGA